jgi:hypothetical protein
MPRCFFAILLLILILSGCASRRPAAWRLVPEGNGHRLVPPRPHPEDPSFTLRRARSVTVKKPACALDKPGIRIQWKGRDARVRADSNPLAPLPGTVLLAAGGGAPQQQAAEMIVRSNWFNDSLKPSLLAQQRAGCLAPADTPLLTRRLADHLTLPTSATYRLIYGEYADRGYLDIDSRFRLRAVEPIRQSGQITGYRTSFYILTPTPQGGAIVAAGEAESNIKAVITRGPAPDHELLHLPPQATHFRFFFRTWSVNQDRRIALLAAPSPEDLDSATTGFEASPETFCASARQRGVACISVPKDMVIGPELRVLANGDDAYVPVAGSVGEVLRSLNIREPKSLLPTLQVRRHFEGVLRPIDFDSTGATILGLVLIGGEEITW